MGVRNLALRLRSNGPLVPAAATALSLAAFLLGQTAPVVAQHMTLPGKASVDPNGGAGYGIPISVPPGTAGLAPTLSFQYNNQSGNGLLGLGWSLGGLPAVGRCPQTVAQDGLLGRVNYDVNDRFCLDGQRLMAINNGTYGADGTEYRTEIESFSRVISHGTAGTGPAWFEVHTKSGQIMQFGNTTDSQVLVQGQTTARSWAVNKVSDTKGNYFTVTYTVDAPNGQAYPARIDYTGNAGAGLQPYNSVQFVYATRPDVTALYHAGSLIETTQRLTDVKTYAGSSLVADYQLAYSTTITSVSILASITLCAGDGACLQPTTFAVTDSNAWAASGTFTPLSGSFYGTTTSSQSPVAVQGAYGGATFTYPNGWNFGTPPSTNNLPITGDFNGDGKTDFAFAGGTSIDVMLSNGDGTFSGSTFTYPSSVESPNGGPYQCGQGLTQDCVPIVGDFNGDGKTDFAVMGGNAAYVFLSNGDGTFSAVAFGLGQSFGNPPGFQSSNMPITGDFNGDGKTDFAVATGAAVYVYLSIGDGTFSETTFVYPNGWNFGNPLVNFWPIIGDFDGDGRTDFAFSAGTTLYILRSNGDGTFAGSTFTYPNGWNFGTPPQQMTMATPAPIVGDFNGDGKTDFIFLLPSSVPATGYVMLGRGDGTFATSTFSYPSSFRYPVYTVSQSLYTPIVGDFNGDGKVDFAVATATVSYFMLGNGDGSFSEFAFTYPNGWNFGNPPEQNYAPILGNFNGDGKMDFAYAGATTLYMLQATSSPPNFLLRTVTNGLGATTTFTYQPLTNTSVYTKGSGSTYPIADVQAPIYVVSRVDNSNGIGGNLSATYAYAGAKTDYSGRGFLGYRQVTATDLQTSIVKTTTYRQDYPYTAMVARETQSLSGATLSTTNNAYGFTGLGGTRYQVFLTQTQASSADLDGSALPTVTTSYQYDAFGNATQVAVSATDGHSKTTTNTYINDATNWLLGRLTNASVTSVLSQPGAAPPLLPTPPVVVISNSAKNFNLWNYLTANNLAAAGVSTPANVTIVGGVVISSTSTGSPAFDTGAFPSGSTVQLTNNGTIAGAGGNGGSGGACPSTAAASGSPGGPALRAQIALSVTNNGSVWGGGGGGGGGASDSERTGSYLFGGGGGGGAGTQFGGGGAVVQGSLGTPPASGNPGSTSAGGAGGAGANLAGFTGGAGGNGGGPGSAGGNGTTGNVTVCEPAGTGGAPGPAVLGNSFITWTTTGDRRGPLN